jgi:hypothetical protein
MYPLAEMFPALRRYRFPLSRDQVMLLVAALNEFLLGVETYLAHLISGTVVPNEWIPIIFGPMAGMILVLAGLMAIRHRIIATVLASLVFFGSIIVGFLGAYFHLVRAMIPFAESQPLTVPLLVWAPPLLGPFTFALVGLLGLSAVWLEDPVDSGRLLLLGGKSIQFPYSKTKAFFFITGLGALATTISSVLDHARTDFSNPWLWLPTAIGIFTTIIAVMLGATDQPTRWDYYIYTIAMLSMMLIGATGTVLHISQNLTSQGVFVADRFLRGAPILAPLLFADIGMIGLVALMDAAERGNKGSISVYPA